MTAGNGSRARALLRSTRGRIGLLLLLLVVIAGVAAWATQPRTPQQRAELAGQLAAAIHVTATVKGSSLLATNAIADFGISSGIRLVRVRIVDELQVDVRIDTAKDITFAAPPRLCLVGPYSAPDDAGLTDRCWGEPDVTALFAAQLTTDGGGRSMLTTAMPIAISVTLHRGTTRCDYPPGTWQLELTMDPLIDGASSGNREPPAVNLEVPFAGTEALTLVTDSRYCGLAETIYRDQGEPAVVTP